ncbi:putative C6 transcription factor [Hypoxylon sp. FL1150]|nr:putative C6 transcription factor [Hypoxylon sp. FL1150]
MPEPERRRRRPPVSCVLCRQRKIRCNRESPCNNCLRSRTVNCIYENPVSQLPHRTAELSLGPPDSSTPANNKKPSSIGSSSSRPSHASASPATASTRPSYSASQDVESLKYRIKQLEEQLSRAEQNASMAPPQATETITSRISGTFYVHHEDRLAGQSSGAIPRSTSHKSREFGQSHWINGLIILRDIVSVMEPYVREETSKASALMQKSKSLARTIKKRRAPSWPAQLSHRLPPKSLADELVDCYLRTTETVYRILHVPTFKREYDAHWISQGEPSTAFLVQLKLVLAIGATTYDDTFSLRADAMQWVYEAMTWLAEPGFKHRLNLQYIQINLLLLLARELVDVGPDLVWISVGTVLRTSIYMGLHKDPKRLPPNMTTFVAEMRRRLWNTLLELSLQLSLTSGGPPMISLDMFDTEPPGNFDDEQLTTEDPVPKPEDSFTQTSLAIALHKTFPTRLAIGKFLNDHNSHGTYEDTLQLDTELRASFKVVLRTLQNYKTSAEPRPSRFEMDIVEIIINRHFLSLHIPFFAPSLQEAAYAFSRKVAVETALKIWRVIFPPPYTGIAQLNSNTVSPDRHDLTRFAICGSGTFRIISLQASCLISTELRAQLQEEETLGPSFVRQDLLSVVQEAKISSLECIRAGETSIKGHFLIAVVAAQIEALMRGTGKEEFPAYLVGVAVEAEETALAILEDVAAQQQQAEGSGEGSEQTHSTTPSGPLEDWDFPMSDALFDFGSAEQIDWVFEGMPQQEPLLL